MPGLRPRPPAPHDASAAAPAPPPCCPPRGQPSLSAVLHCGPRPQRRAEALAAAVLELPAARGLRHPPQLRCGSTLMPPSSHMVFISQTSGVSFRLLSRGFRSGEGLEGVGNPASPGERGKTLALVLSFRGGGSAPRRVEQSLVPSPSLGAGRAKEEWRSGEDPELESESSRSAFTLSSARTQWLGRSDPPPCNGTAGLGVDPISGHQMRPKTPQTVSHLPRGELPGPLPPPFSKTVSPQPTPPRSGIRAHRDEGQI